MLRLRRAEQTVRPAYNVVHLAGVFHTADAWVRWRLLIGATDKQMAGWLREFPRGGTSWCSGRGSIFGDERPYALIAEAVSDPTPEARPHIDPMYARAPMWCAVDFVAQGVACRLVAYVPNAPDDFSDHDEPGWFAIKSVEGSDWCLVLQISDPPRPTLATVI